MLGTVSRSSCLSFGDGRDRGDDANARSASRE